MKSRIIQALILLVVFALGVIFFSSSSSSTSPEVSNEGYVPPSP